MGEMNRIERMTSLKKINAALLILILCISLGAASIDLLAQETEAIATVNGVVITKAQFYDLLEEQYGAYALQELVQRELVNQKSEAMQISIGDEEFAEVYQMIIAQIGGPEALQMFLMQNNATEAQFIEQLRWNMLLGELAGAEVEVTEEALANWFELNRDYYDVPETVEVSHILVDTEEEAQEILELLKNGGDFKALATEKSLDPGSATLGGYLGDIAKGVTVPEFEEAAFSVAVGEYVLANSNFGWHIITVHSKNQGKTAVLAEIAEEVEKDFRGTAALDARSYMSKLEQEAEIEVLIKAK